MATQTKTRSRTESKKNTRAERTYRLYTEQKDGNLRPIATEDGRSPQEALTRWRQKDAKNERAIKGKSVVGIAAGNIKSLSD